MFYDKFKVNIISATKIEEALNLHMRGLFQLSAVTEYEMPVSICKNTKEGNEEHAMEFRVSAVYHTIPN